jgi:hypothetical protein
LHIWKPHLAPFLGGVAPPLGRILAIVVVVRRNELIIFVYLPDLY